MNKKVCEKCGSEKLAVKPSYGKGHSRRFEIRCLDCGSHNGYINHSQIYKFYKDVDLENLPDNLAIRKIRKSKKTRVVTITCSNCKALLHNSLYEKPKGQYDLMRAIYCPNCGRMFI